VAVQTNKEMPMKTDAVQTNDSLPAPSPATAATSSAAITASAGSPRPPSAKAKPKAAKPAATKAAPAAKPAAVKPTPSKPTPKQPAKAAPAKPAKGTPKLSAMGAAAQVLAASKEPMNVKSIVAAMSEQGLWTSPGGKTPHSTLAAALQRDIAAKGRESRFKKVDKGLYASSGRGN
jgi:hypothetical protein